MIDRDMTPLPAYVHRTTLASGIPLGGLGTGSVELRADGRFHDWEIFNNYLWSGAACDEPPDMWSEDAFFAVRVKPDGAPPRVRLLYDDDKKSRAADGWYDHAIMYNFPFVRSIPGIAYSSRFPFAHLVYHDDALPVQITLVAFSPFIPHNAKDSALPLAFFTFTVVNPSPATCDVSLLFSMRNCVGYDCDQLTLRHTLARDHASVRLHMTATDIDTTRRTFGSMSIAALSPDATWLSAWTDGRGLTGFENAATPGYAHLLYAFRDAGALPCTETDWQRAITRPRTSENPATLHGQRQSGWRWRGALCQKLTLPPGARQCCTFLFAWHFPNHYHYHNPSVRLGHMYENWFDTAAATMDYGITHAARLYEHSRRFCDEFYRGSLPAWLLDSLNAQLTVFPQSFWWTKDGDVAAWEGSACCQIIPNIHTHWSSFQPLMFFPELYTGMKRRMAAFAQGENTSSPFLACEQQRHAAAEQSQCGALGGWFAQRYEQLGYRKEDFTAPRTSRAARTSFLFIDSAVQLLRDFQWSGDRALLDHVWPLVRESINNGLAADTNGDGLQDGAISFITYDHWFLPALNCYKASMWLSELAAAAHLAGLCDDPAFASRCRETLARGCASFERLFWNGSYYRLCYDAQRGCADEGCMADQVSGHLYVRLCGLPPLHNPARVRTALQAVFRHNRVPEHGLLNGADPHPRTDWRYFARYSARGDDEQLAGQWVTPWTGTEYYVAALMIAEGLVDEGLTVAYDVYERHVAMGMLYNHIECGEHYFRPMVAWALLPALQGLVYDHATGTLHIAPQLAADAFDSIFILPCAWGRVTRRHDGTDTLLHITVISGQLPLCTMLTPAQSEPRAVSAVLSVDGDQRACTLHCKLDGACLRLELESIPPLAAGQTLEIRLSGAGTR